MDPARLAELLEPFVGEANDQRLTANDLESISTYIDILLRWNARINLTAIRNPEEIVTRHFGESLFAARHLFPSASHAVLGHRGRAALEGREKGAIGTGALAAEANDQRPATNDALSLADIGSGAGFPGIPIKLWAPQIHLTLIESNHKKATFLREVARALTLTDINIRNVRADTLPPASFDVVTLRAVEQFTSVLPIAAGLVAPAGRLVLLIGSPQIAQASSSLRTLAWSNPIPIPSSDTRILLIATRPQRAVTTNQAS